MSGEASRQPWRPGRRRLSPEEEHLWSAVTRGIKPLRKATVGGVLKPSASGQSGAPIPVAAAATARPTPRAPTPKQTVPHTGPMGIARRDRLNLSRGRTEIDARIDLHGLTQMEAHAALLRFLQRCHANGARFALVITGKGGLHGERGILRRQVPLWLGLGEFRTYVLGFDVASTGHGGEGAFYVRIRGSRRWSQVRP